MFAWKLVLAACTYIVVSLVLFGGVGQPIALATILSDRLGLPLWRWIAALCVLASALIFVIPLKQAAARELRLPTFVVLAMVLPTTIIGLYAEFERRQGLRAFGADEVEANTFFASIREAPQEFQFFLHTAALKDCSVYAWSYRTQSFYKLPPNVAVNVVPQRWIEKCGITRTW